jgi:hypothetical protein
VALQADSFTLTTSRSPSASDRATRSPTHGLLSTASPERREGADRLYGRASLPPRMGESRARLLVPGRVRQIRERIFGGPRCLERDIALPCGARCAGGLLQGEAGARASTGGCTRRAEAGALNRFAHGPPFTAQSFPGQRSSFTLASPRQIGPVQRLGVFRAGACARLGPDGTVRDGFRTGSAPR